MQKKRSLSLGISRGHGFFFSGGVLHYSVSACVLFLILRLFCYSGGPDSVFKSESCFLLSKCRSFSEKGHQHFTLEVVFLEMAFLSGAMSTLNQPCPLYSRGGFPSPQGGRPSQTVSAQKSATPTAVQWLKAANPPRSLWASSPTRRLEICLSSTTKTPRKLPATQCTVAECLAHHATPEPGE